MWLALAAMIVLADLYIVITAMQRFGACPTLVGLMLVGMLGAQLVRLSGLRLIREFQASLARGEPPPEGVLEGLLLFAAGVAFALPGVLTDVIAFLLLVPFVRRWIARYLRGRVEDAIARGQVRVVGFGAANATPNASAPVDFSSRRPNVIDVEGVDVTPHDDDRRLPP